MYLNTKVAFGIKFTDLERLQRDKSFKMTSCTMYLYKIYKVTSEKPRVLSKNL